MIKAIIFDYFDVLVRDDYWHKVSENAALSNDERGIEVLNIGVNDGSLSWAEFCAHVANRMGVTAKEVDAKYHELQLNKQVVLYAKELKERGYLIGLLSNAASEYLRPILRDSGLETLFDAISISTEIGAIKPSAEAYVLTAQLLHVEPGEAVMIDDAMRNVTGAKQAGLFAVQYRTFDQAKDELENLLSKS